MFENNKVCTIIGFVLDVIYLVAMFFLVRLAKDNAVFIVACIAAVAVTGGVGGKCLRTLFSDGGFLCKIAGALIAGIFAVGTIVVIYIAIALF